MESEKLTGWQPIETAPEHEPILVWVPEENRGWDSAEVVIIYRTETGMSFWTNGGSNGGSDVYFRKEPTHWQPLPAPPGTTRAPADLRSALEAETIEKLRSIQAEIRKAARRFDEAASQARACHKRTDDFHAALNAECYDEWAKETRTMLSLAAALAPTKEPAA